jgi:hypothetical protein
MRPCGRTLELHQPPLLALVELEVVPRDLLNRSEHIHRAAAYP